MAGWPRDRLDLPLVRELVAVATIDLYEGRGKQALDRIAAQWRALERSRMLGLEPLYGTLADLRMRAALIAGEQGEARTWAKKLEGVVWGRGPAHLAHAALAKDPNAALRASRSPRRNRSPPGSISTRSRRAIAASA
jgi:hypothetical protein